MRRVASILAVLVLLLVFGLWWLRGGERTGDRQGPPIVLAAASLQESLQAAAQAWAAKGHAVPVLSFAASPALARQVEAGAPADVFVSADEEWMDTLQGKGLLRPGSRADLLGNTLVLIAPAASTSRIAIAPGFPLAKALGNGRLALADPTGVPAGRYAKAALESLGVWNAVSDRIVSGDSVRAALSLVARGEAPFGIVYATDALAENKVRVVAAFPPSTHAPIVYPLAILKASRSADAEPLRAFLLSPEAAAIFRRHGFTGVRR